MGNEKLLQVANTPAYGSQWKGYLFPGRSGVGLLDKIVTEKRTEEERKPVVSAVVYEIDEAFGKFCSRDKTYEREFLYSKPSAARLAYAHACDAIAGLEYNARDIKIFSMTMGNYIDNGGSFDWSAGFFLSALINNCKESSIQINTLAYDGNRLSWLGYKNTKDLQVEGDVGDELGFGMVSGRIIVYGNSGEKTGAGMGGGIIVVHGRIGSISLSSNPAGNIHEKGVQIVRDGEILDDLRVVGRYTKGDDRATGNEERTLTGWISEWLKKKFS